MARRRERRREDWSSDDYLFTRRFFRMILSIIVLVILVNVVLNIFYWPAMPGAVLPGLWSLVGLLVLLMVLRWFLRWPHGRMFDERWIVRRRYARGDITRAEFKRLMADLKD